MRITVQHQNADNLVGINVFQTLCKKDCLLISGKTVVNGIAAYIECTVQSKRILVPVSILEIIVGLKCSVVIVCTVENIAGWSKDIDAVDVLIRIQKILAGAFERL